MAHRASCSCGQLSITVEGQPFRRSMCHCLACQRRTGSVFAVNARFTDAHVTATEGEASTFKRTGDSGGVASSRFCPNCGATVWWTLDGAPGAVAIAVGAFADPAWPAPDFSVYEEFRHAWTKLGDGVVMEHMD